MKRIGRACAVAQKEDVVLTERAGCAIGDESPLFPNNFMGSEPLVILKGTISSLKSVLGRSAALGSSQTESALDVWVFCLTFAHNFFSVIRLIIKSIFSLILQQKFRDVGGQLKFILKKEGI